MRRVARRPARRSAALALALLVGAAGPALAGPGPDRGRSTERSTERAPYAAADVGEARPEGLSAGVRFAADDPEAFRAALADAAASGRPWLALSGGGENGAFAAGLLNGWTQAGGRPAFGVVTGVSTGALIAPFAFAGPKYDEALRRAYTEVSAADVFEFGGSDESLTDTWPLKRAIERSVTPEFLADVAAEHRAGRRLLVVTTNVDSERPVAWDMGAIAAAGGPRGPALFRAVMLASAAVPGVFPPVLIDMAAKGGRAFQEMHADGGATSPFYVAPGPMVLAEGAGGRPFPTREVYVVVNGRLTPEFEVTRRTTLAVLGHSLSGAIRAQTLAALALSRAFAAREGVTLHVAAIDARFTKTSPAPFDQAYMRALYAYGMSAARARTAFDRRDVAEPGATGSVPGAPPSPASSTTSLPASSLPASSLPASSLPASSLPAGAHQGRRADAR